MRRIPRLLLLLGIAHVVLALALFPRALNAVVIGDESQYFDGARALANLLRDLGSLHSPDSHELSRSVVASGWFMPGMSVVLAPLYLLVPHASLAVARAYLGVLSTLLLFLTARTVHRTFGERYAAAVLVFPGLVPMWVLFGFASWGDLPAGLLVVLLVCEVVRWYRDYVDGLAPTLRDGVRFAALTIALLYLRSSASPLIAGLFALLLLGLLVLLRGPALRRALGAVAMASALFVVVLLPWSLAASHVLGSRVVTTTTVGTALANTFGDRSRECYGPCDPDSTIWFSPVRYARETARATGRGEVEVLAQMSSYARTGVTTTSYAYDVGQDFGRFTMQPAGYEDWFRPGTAHLDPGPRDWVTPVIRVPTWLLYFPALAAGALVMLVAVRGPRDRQLTVIALKLTGAALMLQPFVHPCTSRYWPTFGPLFALCAAVLYDMWRSRRRRDEAPDATGLLRWLFRIQVLLSAGALAAGSSLIFLGTLA